MNVLQNTAKVPQFFFIEQYNLTMDPIRVQSGGQALPEIKVRGPKPTRPPASATYAYSSKLWLIKQHRLNPTQEILAGDGSKL